VHGASKLIGGFVLLAVLSAEGFACAAEPHELPGASMCKWESHAGYRECLENKALEREKLIAAAEQSVRDAITHWDEEPNDRKRTADLFAKSRRAYYDHRTATCEVMASTAAGGNGASDLRLECQERLDTEWYAHLKRLVARFNP
jgi:uncharacterized protein YecT (DUF1311 family)